MLYGPKQLADGIRTVRQNVVLIAEDIHEDDYLFRPSVGSRSVAEILIHIGFFSNFDYLFHGEEHVTAVEAFRFWPIPQRQRVTREEAPYEIQGH